MIQIPKVRYTSNGQYVCLGRTEFASFATDTEEVIYRAISSEFSATLNGIPCEVRECRVSAMPFNRPWPGKQRPYDQSEWAGFLSFSADEAVELRVKRSKSFERATVKPQSRGIATRIEDGEVVFTLEKHGNYVLEFGDTHHALHIFFNEPKDCAEAKDATLSFGPGMHFPGVITLRDNDRIYIDPEAIVFGSIFSRGAKNVKIFGGGVIDNSSEERISENCYEDHTKGTFRIYNCSDIEVSDIILTNSSTWAMAMFDCTRILVDNVKIVGHWRYNTDGIDVVNSDHVTVRNCFIRSFDDTVSIKAIYGHPKPVEAILVENSVLWCGWGKTCEIGVETDGVEYKNVVFRNCDAIHNSVAAMTVSNGNGADMHDILFENINVELEDDIPAQVTQTADGQTYDSEGRCMAPCLLRVSNTPYAVRQRNPHGIVRKRSDRVGDVHDVTYRGIRIFTEGKEIKPHICIKSADESVILKNFKLEDVYLNGKRVTDFGSFSTEFRNAENITVE